MLDMMNRGLPIGGLSLPSIDPQMARLLAEEQRRQSAPYVVRPGETAHQARERQHAAPGAQSDLERRRQRLARHGGGL